MSRRRGPAPPADAPNLLDLVPVPTARSTEAGDLTVVERTLPPVRGFKSFFLRLSFLTGVKRLRLDELGTAVWRRLDGRRTVAEVAAALREEFGAGCEPAEERLGMFLGMLRRERLIAYAGLDDDEIADWNARDAAAAGPPAVPPPGGIEPR